MITFASALTACLQELVLLLGPIVATLDAELDLTQSINAAALIS